MLVPDNQMLVYPMHHMLQDQPVMHTTNQLNICAVEVCACLPWIHSKVEDSKTPQPALSNCRIRPSLRSRPPSTLQRCM